MTESLVSILIPVYNAGAFLRPSVESILSQTYSNLEILVIDDGSTDGCMDTIADIKDRRVRTLSQQNSGRASALNHGLDELHGEFYAIHDADDISYPQRIERQVKRMLENPAPAAVFTGHDIIIGGQRLAPRFATKSVAQCHRENDQFRMPAHDPTAMFRLSMVRDIRYEPTLKVGAGLDYILRVGELYPMTVLGECLYSYRIHLNSTTRQDPNLREEMVREVLRRACKRRGVDFTRQFQFGSDPAVKLSYREQETGLVPHFMESVLDLRRAGRDWDSLRTAVACLRLHPIDPYYYKPLCYFLAPLELIECYRSWKAKRG
jgi:glycosyltransferase involved in cell wall biosynthesis